MTKHNCKRKKFCLGKAFIGGALIVAVTTAVVGCSRWHTPEKRAKWVTKIIASELDLTDAQETRLHEIKDDYLAARKRNQAKHDSMFQKAKKIVLSEKMNENDVRNLIQEKRQAMDQEFPNFFPKVQDFHASLSIEQKQKAVELLEEFKKKMHGNK